MPKKKTEAITAEQAVGLIDALAEAIHDSRQADQQVEYNGLVYTGIYTDELDKTIRSVCDQTLGRDVEPQAYGAVMQIERLARAYAEWLYRVSMGTTTPQGSPAVNKCLEDILTFASRRPVYEHPESVDRLRKRGASDAQIARIYGWIDGRGFPNVAMVGDEAEKPGTHYQKETWIHPAQKAQLRSDAESWSQHVRSTTRLNGRQMDPSANKLSIEDLLKGGAKMPQILRNYPDADEDEVAALAEMLGVKLNERSIVPANATVATREYLDLNEAKLAELEAELSK